MMLLPLPGTPVREAGAEGVVLGPVPGPPRGWVRIRWRYPDGAASIEQAAPWRWAVVGEGA